MHLSVSAYRTGFCRLRFNAQYRTVSSSKYGAALTIVIRDCGLHQVESTTATIATSAISEAVLPPGARIGKTAISARDNLFRMLMCAAKAITHASIPPKREAP